MLIRYQTMSTEGATPSDRASSEETETQSGLDENDFVRFHALQSIIFSVAAFVLYWVLNTLLFSLFFGRSMFMPGGGLLFSLLSLISSVVSVVLLGVWLFLMFQAYSGEWYKLPVVGDLAEQNL